MEKQLLPLGLAGRDEVVEELADVEEERDQDPPQRQHGPVGVEGGHAQVEEEGAEVGPHVKEREPRVEREELPY